jgi:Flp pilus assembly protein TadG
MEKKESGQIIVVLALVLVAVLGVTALAVDSSMIYMDRRNDQSTADSAALAAAQAASGSPICATAQTQAISAAQQYASAQEGVALANDAISPSRVEATCSGDNKTLTIKVVVTSITPTTFAKMVSRNQLQTTVESTSQVTFGGGTFAGGNGVVATNTEACTPTTGISVVGTSVLQTVGGSIFTNNCINLTGDAKVVAYGGTTQYYTALNISGGGGVRALNDTNPLATPTNTVINLSIPQSSQPLALRASKATSQFPELTIPAMVAQTCEGLTDYGRLDQKWADHVVTVPGGKYDSIKVNIDALFPENSIYCIKPGGSVELQAYPMTANKTIWYFMGEGSFIKQGNYTLTMDNSSIYIQDGDFIVRGSANIIAHNITVYIKKGNFILSGNVAPIMTAPNCDNSDCGVGPGIKGVLLLMDKTNTSGEINIAGSSTLTMEGTVFAPGSRVIVHGDSGVTSLKTQFIAKDIRIQGSSTIKLDLTNANIYTASGGGSVELLK